MIWRGAQIFLLVIVPVLTMPSTVRAELRSLTKARVAFEELDYPKALKLLDKTLASKKLTATDEADALAMKAVVMIAYGKMEDADKAYFELLRINPSFEVPDNASPEMQMVFEGARDRFEREQPDLKYVDDDLGILPGDEIERPEPEVTHREVIDVTVEPEKTEEVPTDPFLNPALKDNLTDSAIDEVDTGTPVYETWWFWTIIGGVVVAGAAVGTTVYLTQPPTAEYGPFALGAQ